MKRSDFEGVPPSSPAWWENKSIGLVFSSSHSELRRACYFPQLLSGRSLLAAELSVTDQQGYWIGSCSVHSAFAHWFEGSPSQFHFHDGVYFKDIAGHESEQRVSITPREWVRTNTLALEALHRRLVENEALLKEETLPNLDLASGVIKTLVNKYKFKASEFPDAEAAKDEFCRRFSYKADFARLLHPDLSVRRFFEKEQP